MHECVCLSCRYLKSVIAESGEVTHYECKFGFPAEECEDCEEEQCERTCENYKGEQEETMKTVQCKGCGKELQQHCEDEADGDFYCMDCFLTKES